MMGAGIAYVQAAAGIETVLIDVDQAAADRGRAYSEKLVAKGLERGSTTVEKGEQLLGRINATTDYAHIDGSDLVIEAVFENREIKADVTRRAEERLAPTAVFASNTSTLPITSLAENSRRPANFIGLHFFSPVDKMGLVEIILGEKTSPETLAKAVDYVLKIRKTPIVVNDRRGFYTSRVFATYTEEGHAMLQEGVAPALIDNAGRMCGMPRGPLELTDDVAIDLVHKINEQARVDLGEAYTPEPARQVVARMVELGRFGRKNRQGFYDYPTDGPKRLWPGLGALWPVQAGGPARQVVDELRTRLLYRQAVEAARCVDEGVLTDPRYADVGAILGWGFAPWTGGPLSLIDSVGARQFVDTCDRLATTYGGRFAPPPLLRRMADVGECFYGAPTAARAAA
jgi:3-hydroxyacyl-CoA dehydrogenase/enoyl-CoA hydratase/3-hydroxybutyryl-CoA epimerase